MITLSIPEKDKEKMMKSVLEVSGRVTKEMTNVINQGMLAIETRAKEFSPVDTGRLRSSIHAVPYGKADNYQYQFGDGSLGVAKDNDRKPFAFVGTNVEYAQAQEFGEEGTRGKKFLTRATEEIRPKLVEELNRLNVK
jgi:HK97 gp10 family phage protein